MSASRPSRSHAGLPRRLVGSVVGVSVALAALATLVLASPAIATQDGTGSSGESGASSVVEVLPVTGLLDPPVASTITRLLDQAAADDAELVVLQVSGPGGVSIDTSGLLDAIEDATVPVAVLVAPQAGVDANASGAWAALWSVADVRAVSEVATVGPVQPVDLSQAPSTVVSDRVLASLGPQGSDLLDQSLDAADLEASGLADVVAPDVATLLGDLDGVDVGDGRTLSLAQDDVQVRLHSLGLLARMLHAAATPAFIYLLLVVGLCLLAFELFQPGFGVAGFAGLVMLPFAVFGLTVLPVAWWALGLVLVGLALFAVDTALAGLGPTTLAASASFGAGSWFLFGTGALRNPGWVAVATTVIAIAFWVVGMTTILRAQAGPEGVELADLVGRPGIVRSILNPEGHVYIDEALWRARLDEGTKLRVGSPVRVAGVDGAVLVVEPFHPPGDDGTDADAHPDAEPRTPAGTATSGVTDPEPPA